MSTNRYRVFKTNPKLRGITDDTLRFWRRRKSEFGRVVEAIMYPYDQCMFPDSRKYCFVLINANGDRMYLGGCAAGYGGEGPRATIEVLHDSGLLSTRLTKRGIEEIVNTFIKFHITEEQINFVELPQPINPHKREVVSV